MEEEKKKKEQSCCDDVMCFRTVEHVGNSEATSPARIRKKKKKKSRQLNC